MWELLKLLQKGFQFLIKTFIKKFSKQVEAGKKLGNHQILTINQNKIIMQSWLASLKVRDYLIYCSMGIKMHYKTTILLIASIINFQMTFSIIIRKSLANQQGIFASIKALKTLARHLLRSGKSILLRAQTKWTISEKTLPNI